MAATDAPVGCAAALAVVLVVEVRLADTAGVEVDVAAGNEKPEAEEAAAAAAVPPSEKPAAEEAAGAPPRENPVDAEEDVAEESEKPVLAGVVDGAPELGNPGAEEAGAAAADPPKAGILAAEVGRLMGVPWVRLPPGLEDMGVIPVEPPSEKPVDAVVVDAAAPPRERLKEVAGAAAVRGFEVAAAPPNPNPDDGAGVAAAAPRPPPAAAPRPPPPRENPVEDEAGVEAAPPKENPDAAAACFGAPELKFNPVLAAPNPNPVELEVGAPNPVAGAA